MKTKLSLFILALLNLQYVHAQLINIGLKNEPVGSPTINVYLRPQANRTGTNTLSSLVFTVRWPSNTNQDLGGVTSTFSVNKAGSETKLLNGFEYQKFSSIVEHALPENWQISNEVLIASFNSIPGTEPLQNQGGFRETNTFVIDPSPASTVGPSGDLYIEITANAVAADETGMVFSDAVLPIKIDGFSLKQNQSNQTLIQWSTLGELNSSHFEVLRSNDTKYWTTIGTVTAAGSSSARKTYSFLDQHLSTKNRIIYYRIKSVDLSQFFTLTETKSIQFGHGALLNLSNTLVNDRLIVEYDGMEQQQFEFRILDIQGRTISISKLSLPEGRGKHDISSGIANLPAGIYHLVGSSPEQQWPALRFIKLDN